MSSFKTVQGEDSTSVIKKNLITNLQRVNQERNNLKVFNISDLTLEYPCLIDSAEKVTTKFGETIKLYFINTDLSTFAVFIGKEYINVFTDETIREVNNKNIRLTLTNKGLGLNNKKLYAINLYEPTSESTPSPTTSAPTKKRKLTEG